jgi:Ribonucleotide reductase, alpha subunit
LIVGGGCDKLVLPPPFRTVGEGAGDGITDRGNPHRHTEPLSPTGADPVIILILEGARMEKSTLTRKFERKTVRLEGLSEKIFLDRYARKDLKPERLEPGDTVLVLTKDDPRFPQKEVGEVIEVGLTGDAVRGVVREQVRVRLRSGQEIVVDKEKLVKPLETTPDQMWDRIAKAVAAAEAPEKRAEWEEKFRYLLDDWKMVPGGRILAGAGVTEELTLFNCYVLPSPKDSRGGIMETLTQMTEIMSRGGGVGINLSSLRPRRALVRGVNGSSSGAVSWGGLFSYTTGLIEQGGSRRGALMLMLNDWHPDLLEFITVKTQMGLLTNANLSVCISDAFMQAVKEDKEWHLVFPDTSDPDYDEVWDGNLEKWKALGKPIQVYKTVRARDVWHTIIESAWRSAEPGSCLSTITTRCRTAGTTTRSYAPTHAVNRACRRGACATSATSTWPSL